MSSILCSKILIHYNLDPTIFSTPAAPLITNNYLNQMWLAGIIFINFICVGGCSQAYVFVCERCYLRTWFRNPTHNPYIVSSVGSSLNRNPFDDLEAVVSPLVVLDADAQFALSWCPLSAEFCSSMLSCKASSQPMMSVEFVGINFGVIYFKVYLSRQPPFLGTNGIPVHV